MCYVTDTHPVVKTIDFKGKAASPLRGALKMPFEIKVIDAPLCYLRHQGQSFRQTRR